MEKNIIIPEFDSAKPTSTASANYTKPIVLTYEDLNRQLPPQDDSHDIHTREVRHRHYNHSNIYTLYPDEASNEDSDFEIITLDDWTSERETCWDEDEDEEAEIDYGEDEIDNKIREDDTESGELEEDEVDEMILIKPRKDFWSVVK